MAMKTRDQIRISADDGIMLRETLRSKLEWYEERLELMGEMSETTRNYYHELVDLFNRLSCTLGLPKKTWKLPGSASLRFHTRRYPMKTRCRYCRRLVRVMNTRTRVPRLVKHSLPPQACDAEGIPHGTPCYGTHSPAIVHNVSHRLGATA